MKHSVVLMLAMMALSLALPALGWASGGSGFAWEAPIQSLFESIVFIASICAGVAILFAAVLVLLGVSALFSIVVGIVFGLGILGSYEFILGLFGVTVGAVIL